MNDVRQQRAQYFNSEDYLSPEDGYPERNTAWFRTHVLPDFKRRVSDSSQLRLLDVGCAFGYFTRILGSLCASTTGIDFTLERIKYAKKYESDTIKFVHGDLTQKLNLDQKYDVFFSNAVIPHIPLQWKVAVFDNLAEVANPGARFLLYDGKTDRGIVDEFVGLFSPEWIAVNVKTWKLLSCEPVIGETFCYSLQLA